MRLYIFAKLSILCLPSCWFASDAIPKEKVCGNIPLYSGSGGWGNGWCGYGWCEYWCWGTVQLKTNKYETNICLRSL